MNKIHENRETEKNEIENEYRKEALQILVDDEPLNYMVNAISLRHYGDKEVIKALILSFPATLSGSVAHRYILGPSGSGKTNACNETGKILPKDIYQPLAGSSAKSKIYQMMCEKNALSNKIFYYDYTQIDNLEFRRLLRIIKDLEPGEVKFYETVLDGRYTKIPVYGNCAVWESSVKLPEDKQDYSRAFLCTVESSKNHKELVDKKIIELTGLAAYRSFRCYIYSNIIFRLENCLKLPHIPNSPSTI